MSSVTRVTSPRHYIWGHIYSLSHIALSQTQYLVTHVHILRGAVISQILYLGHMSTVSNVNHQPDPVPGVKYLPFPEDTLHTLYLRSHLQNIQDDIPTQILHLVSPVHSLQCDHPPRPCTWGHTSTMSYVTALPRS